jgi:RHS repeat-associated protein
MVGMYSFNLRVNHCQLLAAHIPFGNRYRSRACCTDLCFSYDHQRYCLDSQAIFAVVNLRFPGQYADSETGLFYNYFRSYQAAQGRYTQNDPIGMDGGLNRLGYVDANPLSFFDAFGLCPCGDPVDLIQLARSDKRDWSKAADRSDVNKAFGKDTYKCNLFADDQFETAGYHVPKVGGMPWSKGKYPPGAGQLVNPRFKLDGWPVVSGPAQPGDLVAHGKHVGIAVTDRSTISASPNGKVENDWGFRPTQTSTVVRRCSCAR